MEKVKNQLLIEINKIDDTQLLVSIFELTGHRIGATSFTDMGNREGKSTQGIRKSNAYRKITIGNVKLVISGLRDVDSSLPF